MTGILGLIGLIVPMTVHPAAVAPVPAPQQQQAPAGERTASPQLQPAQRACVITHDDKAKAFQVVCR